MWESFIQLRYSIKICFIYSYCSKCKPKKLKITNVANINFTRQYWLEI